MSCNNTTNPPKKTLSEQKIWLLIESALYEDRCLLLENNKQKCNNDRYDIRLNIKGIFQNKRSSVSKIK